MNTQPEINSKQEKKIKPLRAEMMMLMSCAAFFLLLTLILSPIYSAVSADIVLYATLLPDALELIIQLIEISAFAVCYTLVILCAFKRGVRETVSVCAVYVAACAIRRALTALITFLQYGNVSPEEVLSLVFYIVLETAQILLVLAFSNFYSKDHRASVAAAKKAALRTGGYVDSAITLKSLYSSYDSIKKTAFASGIMLALVKIFSRIIYDFTYGAPSGISEVLIMVVYYLSDILIALIFYAMCLFILNRVIPRK